MGDEEEEEPQQAYRKLVFFRCTVFALSFLCIFSNLYTSGLQIELISCYSKCPNCKFTLYETLALVADILIVSILITGIYFVLSQKTHGLRIYLMILFLSTWLQLLLMLLLTQRYPLVHDVHYKWKNHESIAEYESKYGCCGVLGPDDYLLTTGTLPRSCFQNHSNSTDDLYETGCLNKEGTSSDFLRWEFLTTLFQLLLLFFTILYYLHLKEMKLPERTFRDIWRARFVL